MRGRKVPSKIFLCSLLFLTGRAESARAASPSRRPDHPAERGSGRGVRPKATAGAKSSGYAWSSASKERACPQVLREAAARPKRLRLGAAVWREGRQAFAPAFHRRGTLQPRTRRNAPRTERRGPAAQPARGRLGHLVLRSAKEGDPAALRDQDWTLSNCNESKTQSRPAPDARGKDAPAVSPPVPQARHARACRTRHPPWSSRRRPGPTNTEPEAKRGILASLSTTSVPGSRLPPG
jgi:hypothetical protein